MREHTEVNGASHPAAVDQYLHASRARWFFGGRSEDQLALERKSCAQRLARSATETIAERKHRAAAKVTIYNHLIPILDQHHLRQRALHRTYRRVLAGMCAALLLAMGAAVLL